MKRYFSLLIFACALLSYATTKAEVIEHIVAVVNNEIVTESDLKRFAIRLEKGSFIDDLLLFGKSPADLKKSHQDQLEYLINERILDSEIKRLNLSVTMDRVDQEIREIAKKNSMSKSELLNTIKQQGQSVSEYQDFIKSRLERQSLIETEITSKIRISDEDLMAQYARNHPNAGAGIYEYTLAHILFNPRKGGEAAAQARAESVLQKIKAGGSFDVLAEQHSEDANFSTGGLLGTFKAGEFSKEFEDAVAKINVGETTGVVKSKSGFHILKLLGKKIVSDPQFEKEKEKLRGQLFERSFQKQFKNWLESKRDDSFIRINK